jgi:hypothetical protein
MYRGTGRPPSLPDCTVKPSLGGRGKRSGTLEIHANGVRYKSPQVVSLLTRSAILCPYYCMEVVWRALLYKSSAAEGRNPPVAAEPAA